MLKNRLFATLSLVALLGAAACGGDAEEEVIEEQAAPTPERLSTDDVIVDSAVTAGAIIMDTSNIGAIVDTTTP